MKCINCQKEFVSQRLSAKFCSPKCRVAFSRKSSVTELSVTGEEITIKTPPTVTPPQEEKVSVTKFTNMTDEQLLVEADKMAVREYLARGYFGGKRNPRTGEIKYFPFNEVKQAFYEMLKKGQAALPKKPIKEVTEKTTQVWTEVGRCENCFKDGQLIEKEVPTYNKETGEMVQTLKRICQRCVKNLEKMK